jgi:hypothetical protein
MRSRKNTVRIGSDENGRNGGEKKLLLIVDENVESSNKTAARTSPGRSAAVPKRMVELQFRVPIFMPSSLLIWYFLGVCQNDRTEGPATFRVNGGYLARPSHSRLR